MTTKLIINRVTGIELTDENTLTGNTYPVKNYIRSYLGGVWDKSTKEWTIEIMKLNDLVTKKAIAIDDSAPAAPAKKEYVSGWCNKCHSYCYGDCQS